MSIHTVDSAGPFLARWRPDTRSLIGTVLTAYCLSMHFNGANQIVSCARE